MVDSPPTAGAAITADTPSGIPIQQNLVLRIIRRDNGQVMLVSHIEDEVHLPIGDSGYLDSALTSGKTWNIDFNRFTGGSNLAGTVDSVCTPFLHFLSPEVYLAEACASTGDPRLYAFTTEGRRLWQNLNPGPDAWPTTVTSANGLRFARESLIVDHAINASMPLSPDDIKGQDVQVIDSATGKLILRAAASPVFDAGGNVALSPSGRRAAILMDGNIQIFDLPAPAPIPAPATARNRR